MARGGKLDINIDSVRLINGDKAALRAVQVLAGGGHTGAMTGAMIATSLVVWPAAPFFVFMHGKDVTVPKGAEITAYIYGDVDLTPSRATLPVPPHRLPQPRQMLPGRTYRCLLSAQNPTVPLPRAAPCKFSREGGEISRTA